MGGLPGIIQLYRLPAELLQLPACQHGADGCLPHGSHALFDQLFRLLIRLPFLEQVLQFLPAFLIPVSYTHLDVYKRQARSTTASRYRLKTIWISSWGSMGFVRML